MQRITKGIVVVTMIVEFFYIFPVPYLYAHPGNTASDGCHYCRTNCSKWGEIANQRHCHGGSSYSGPFANSGGNDSGYLWGWAALAGWLGFLFLAGRKK